MAACDWPECINDATEEHEVPEGGPQVNLCGIHADEMRLLLEGGELEAVRARFRHVKR